VSDLVPVKRALISVFDKTHLPEFARALHTEFNVELLSTGGTARFLRELGLPVTDVSDVTNFPEMMDGRVKTLHPKIHGGLLAIRDNPDHRSSMETHGIRPIDLVCINLYPFEKTVAKPSVTFEEAIENIDIGGPAMIRSAAKNHRYVLVVTSPDRYEKVLGDLRQHNGSSCGNHRLKQAHRAFSHTAAYDSAIQNYLASQLAPKSTDAAALSPSPSGGEGRGEGERPASGTPSSAEQRPAQPSLSFVLKGEGRGEGPFLHPNIVLHLTKKSDLRYGENPHQKAALYTSSLNPEPRTPNPHEASVAHATQHHGKDLSYINLLDADAAMSVVKEFSTPAACIVKHATPCGAATAHDLPTAFENAFASDPLAAFGGIVALNKPVDRPTAEAITSIDKLLEVIVAPSYTPDALDLLKTRWKNVRLLEAPGNWQPTTGNSDRLFMHKIVGGYLVQDRDLLGLDETSWKVASNRRPTPEEIDELRFAWLICKHVKSNAIVVSKNKMLLGAGAGQMDRPSAARLAIEKAGNRIPGSVAASDAFFPFPDAPRLLLDAGVTALIHPGGSLKDQETIDLVNQRNAAMILTGQRHFRH
jgi:phosphoribosylaminoimidazolecarboxamide formyltransferase/IMP cyclohydrolase